MANFKKGYKCTLQISREEMLEYADYFKSMRKSINYTQTQMADNLGVHPSTYRRWEWGKRIPQEDIGFIVDCVKTIVERERKVAA